MSKPHPKTLAASGLGLAALLISLAPLAPSGCSGGRKTLRVFAADALSHSFHEIEREFERLHPDTDVSLDIQGSIFLTRLVPLRRADVVAVADHRLIQKILYPKHATWVAKFATTELVIAATTASARGAEISPENWYDILLRPDVRYGYADPSQDPCGYYTRLAWQLAENHYAASHAEARPLAKQLIENCPTKHIARDALCVISDLLGTARVDYAFVYRVHAVDQRLPFTPLPKEIHLGDRSLAQHYASAEVLVPNYRGGMETMTGSYIGFGITIPSDAPNPEDAQEFVRFVLSQSGRAILERSEFQPIQPALVPKWGTVPEFLGELAAAED